MWNAGVTTDELRKNKKESLQLCMHASVRHFWSVSILSFIVAEGELAAVLPSVTKPLITTFVLIMSQHSSTFTTFVMLQGITYQGNAQPWNHIGPEQTICHVLSETNVQIILTILSYLYPLFQNEYVPKTKKKSATPCVPFRLCLNCNTKVFDVLKRAAGFCSLTL